MRVKRGTPEWRFLVAASFVMSMAALVLAILYRPHGLAVVALGNMVFLAARIRR